MLRPPNVRRAPAGGGRPSGRDLPGGMIEAEFSLSRLDWQTLRLVDGHGLPLATAGVVAELAYPAGVQR